MKLAWLRSLETSHQDCVWACAWVPATDRTSGLLLTGSLDETVKLWNPEDLSLVRTNSGHCLGVVSVAAHPSGKIAASASMDSFIRVFDVESNNTIATLEAPPSEVWQMQFDPRGNIQTLSAADLDRYKANVWLLSPPCQPYTRQGLQKQSADARASSFLRILEIIPELMQPPGMIFVENVVGFETSDTRQKMVQILEESQFVTQEFILSPLQFGVPYSRPRYFCLAKRKPSSFCNPEFNRKLICEPKPLFGHKESTSISENDQLISTSKDMHQTCLPIERFLDFGESINQDSFASEDSLNQYLVPSSLIERWGSAMGILETRGA